VNLVVQQSLRTPTEPSFGNCCTRGIRGLVFGSLFTKRSTNRTLFFAVASAVAVLTEDSRFRRGFDRSACARVRVAADAHADVAALTPLAALLRQVLNDRLASLLSSASILSRDQYRGERSMRRHCGGRSRRKRSYRPARSSSRSTQARSRSGTLCNRSRRSPANWRHAGSKIAVHDAANSVPVVDPAPLNTLAADLNTVWTDPSTDARLKKRIVRAVIHEVIADVDAEAAEIVLVIHWVGGVHGEIRLPRRRRGQRSSTSADVITAVRQLVLIANDNLIAGILEQERVADRLRQSVDA
jgi:hypothetical protein